MQRTSASRPAQVAQADGQVNDIFAGMLLGMLRKPWGENASECQRE